MLHDPDDKRGEKTSSLFAMRGFLNVGVLLILISGLLCLLIFSVLTFIRNNALLIKGNKFEITICVSLTCNVCL